MTVEPAPSESEPIDAHDSAGEAARREAQRDDGVAALLARCTFAPRGTAVVCALSGGPDSAALVALAVAAGLDVSAVHVDHGLRADSPEDAALARAIAERLDVPFRCERVDVPGGPNLEARARAARRAVVGLDALTGHTADDQAETLLLSLVRGAGGAGLAAMRPGPTKPILALRRSDTRALCARLDLIVADDPTNADPRFRRNRIRHEVLPLLNEIAERDVVTLLTRSSSLLRDDEVLLGALAAEIDPSDARALAAAPLPLARRAVRDWIVSTVAAAFSADDATVGDVERHPPDAATVGRVLDVARGDATGCDVGRGWRVERSRQRLRLFPTVPTSS